MFWLNLGDSYAGSWGNYAPTGKGGQRAKQAERWQRGAYDGKEDWRPPTSIKQDGLKPKDLVGIPWLVAFALRADGWYLRSDIIWAKPNPMPESVTDRPTKAHEYIFLLTKSGTAQYWVHPRKRGKREKPKPDYVWRHKNTGETIGYQPVSNRLVKKFWTRSNLWQGKDYYYDAEAVKEQSISNHPSGNGFKRDARLSYRDHNGARGNEKQWQVMPSRNRRTVWTIATEPFPGSHFAVFPQALVEPCILAGTSEKACPKCGAPWERIVERKPAVSKGCPKTQAAHEARGGTGKPVGTVGKSGSGRIEGYSKTTGFQPTCTCPNNDGSGACVVLDPFGGSGTVSCVAKRLGRGSIYIDLKPEYLQMALKRMGNQETLFEEHRIEVIQ